MSFVTADQLVAHAVGDYVLQSDWMANAKTQRTWLGFSAAGLHGFTYMIPFLVLMYAQVSTGTSILGLAIMMCSHVLIDHWRLARYVNWFKNLMGSVHPWSECKTTGYHSTRPPWLAVWLMIITDNIMHVLINAACLKWVAS